MWGDSIYQLSGYCARKLELDPILRLEWRATSEGMRVRTSELEHEWHEGNSRRVFSVGGGMVVNLKLSGLEKLRRPTSPIAMVLIDAAREWFVIHPKYPSTHAATQPKHPRSHAPQVMLPRAETRNQQPTVHCPLPAAARTACTARTVTISSHRAGGLLVRLEQIGRIGLV